MGVREASPASPRAEREGASLATLALAAVLSRMKTGTLDVVMPDGGERRFTGRNPGPEATVEIRDPRSALRVIAGGSVAFAEAYMDGAWDTPDLHALMDLGAANADAWNPVDLHTPLRSLRLLRHVAHDNDLAGARRNIEHHYDLGNDFYRLWLDDSMTYSSACFRGPDTEDLETAQTRKWDAVLDLIQPKTGDRLLEIGCGWGGFAMHAAKEAGCRVTGLTLSPEQAALATERVRENGLDGQVDIRIQDYRRTEGFYDGIASIEMFEAVGERWWPAFFGKVRDLLAPGRTAGVQVITIADEDFEVYRRSPDFTQLYIFPGGMLPSPSRFSEEVAAAGLVQGEPHWFGHDYARTLLLWARRFEDALPKVRALGFDERFIRMWRYYLAYCRAGFAADRIDVMQVRLEGGRS